MKLAKHKSNFKLNSTNGGYVDVLSVSSEGQLLVGQYRDRQLHVYSADCRHVTTIKLPDNDKVYDAVWTRRGNIVYSMFSGSTVVTMSLSGDVIRRTTGVDLSVSTDTLLTTVTRCIFYIYCFVFIS